MAVGGFNLRLKVLLGEEVCDYSCCTSISYNQNVDRGAAIEANVRICFLNRLSEAIPDVPAGELSNRPEAVLRTVD